MTYVVQIGEAAIPYAVRYSERAKRKRIVVTPGSVEVVAPVDTPMDGAGGVLAFLDTRRRWLYQAVREVGLRAEARRGERYASGARIQFRGRSLLLDVSPGPVSSVEIRCRSRFHVTVPEDMLGLDRAMALRRAFELWFRQRAAHDIARFARHHEAALGVKVAGADVSDDSRRWGSSTSDGVIRVHWELVRAPMPAMEYVVAHEVAHLVHRNHSPEFWALLARTMPDWPERKRMLEQWEEERREV